MSKLLMRIGLSLLGNGAIRWVLETYVYPNILKFVAKTDNKYDYAAAEYIIGFLDEVSGMVESDL